MYEAYLAQRCVFDDPLPVQNEVLFANSTHRIWRNPYPLKHTELHLIIAPIHHILGSDPVTFSREYRVNEAEVVEWAYDNFTVLREKGGGEVKRFGPSKYNCGSVEHDHRNLIVPALTGNVRITIAQKENEIDEAINRLNVYFQLYCGKQVSDLDPIEQKLIEGRLD